MFQDSLSSRDEDREGKEADRARVPTTVFTIMKILQTIDVSNALLHSEGYDQGRIPGAGAGAGRHSKQQSI